MWKEEFHVYRFTWDRPYNVCYTAVIVYPFGKNRYLLDTHIMLFNGWAILGCVRCNKHVP